MNDWRDLKVMTKAVADVARLTIIYYLARQEHMTVTSLAEVLHLSQPLVSWHLRKLQRAGLIETRRQGRQVYCALNRQRFEQCLQALERVADPQVQLADLPNGPALIEGDTPDTGSPGEGRATA